MQKQPQTSLSRLFVGNGVFSLMSCTRNSYSDLQRYQRLKVHLTHEYVCSDSSSHNLKENGCIFLLPESFKAFNIYFLCVCSISLQKHPSAKNNVYLSWVGLHCCVSKDLRQNKEKKKKNTSKETRGEKEDN